MQVQKVYAETKEMRVIGYSRLASIDKPLMLLCGFVDCLRLRAGVTTPEVDGG